MRTDTTEFPFSRRDKTVQYLLTYWDGEKLEVEEFVTVSDKKKLVQQLSDLLGHPHLILIGTWHGNYSTSFFQLDVTETYNLLVQEFGVKKND